MPNHQKKQAASNQRQLRGINSAGLVGDMVGVGVSAGVERELANMRLSNLGHKTPLDRKLHLDDVEVVGRASARRHPTPVDILRKHAPTKPDGLDASQFFDVLAVENSAIGGHICFLWQFNFDPYSKFRSGWDLFMLILVLYSIFTGPYAVAFGPTNYSMKWHEVIIDLFFYTDILFNFWTGFDNGYEILYEKRAIALNYLRLWFWIDFLATVEWDLLLEAVFGMTGPMIRLTRLLKVLRLARMGRLIARLTASWTVNTGFITAAKFFMYVLIVAHLLACGFYLWPTLHTCEASDEERAGNSSGDWAMADAADPTSHLTSHEHRDKWLDTCVAGAWRDKYGLHGLTSWEQYIQALYWSVTSMTTIGYGDISAASYNDVQFSLFAEVAGLAFFALLMEQINRVMHVMQAENEVQNEIKNPIVQFLKWNHVDKSLIKDVVRYLSFRSSSAAAHSITDDDPRMKMLPPHLRDKIRLRLSRPLLEKIRLFGHKTGDRKEQNQLKKMFSDIDEDNSKSLDRQEILQLIENLGMQLSDADVTAAINEMDDDGGGCIDFDEFQSWWYMKKYNMTKPIKCPEGFLNALALGMTLETEAVHSVIVPSLHYGESLFVVMIGGLRVVDSHGRTDGRHHDDDQVISNVVDESGHEAVDTTVAQDQTIIKFDKLNTDKLKGTKLGGVAERVGKVEINITGKVTEKQTHVLSSTKAITKHSEDSTMIGLAALLNEEDYARVRSVTSTWQVETTSFCDLLKIDRNLVQHAFERYWPQGRVSMRETALRNYKLFTKESAFVSGSSYNKISGGRLDEQLGALNKQIESLERKLGSVEQFL